MFMREFSTVLSDLLELSDWLTELGCTEVAMERTQTSIRNPSSMSLKPPVRSPLLMPLTSRTYPDGKPTKRMHNGLLYCNQCGFVSNQFCGRT